MQGHNGEQPSKRDEILKFRVEEELKQKIEQMAKRGRKTTAQLVREKLWQIVEEDEKDGGQEVLPLTGSGGRE